MSTGPMQPGIPRSLIICPHGKRRPLEVFEAHEPVHSWPQWTNVLPDCKIAMGTDLDDASAEKIADRELFIIIGGRHAHAVLTALRARFPDTPVAAIQDANTGWCSYYAVEHCWGTGFRNFMKFYREVDVIFSATRNAISFYRMWNPTVRYIGLPYPEEYLKLALDVTEREHDLLAVGGRVRTRRGTLLGLFVAKQAGYRVILLSDPSGETRSLCESLGLQSERIVLTDQVSFLKRIRKARLAIYLDEMGSVGRFARDCAALRIPCLTSTRTDFAGRVGEVGIVGGPWWRIEDPDYHVEEVVFWLKHMAENWTHVVEWQRSQLRTFDTQTSRFRFGEALDWL